MRLATVERTAPFGDGFTGRVLAVADTCQEFETAIATAVLRVLGFVLHGAGFR